MDELETPTTPSFFQDDERFKQLVGVLIALVTLVAAIVGWLQNDAGTRDEQANRIAQNYALQAVGQRITGNARAGYDWGDAYRNWSELNTLALAAENNDDPAAAERYRAVAARMTQLSPLLAPPYFDPAGDAVPNIAGYEADTYLVTATAQTERFLAWFEVKQAWSGKADTYIVHLTILAVALFLFGLASTVVSSRIRWIFVAVGCLITVVTVGWVLAVFLSPVERLPDPAIDAYAEGIGLSYQGNFEQALASFNKALEHAPNYASALFERANSHYDLGDYQAAAKDYEAARAAGRDDSSLSWNLAWMYYLQGNLDQAIQVYRRAIERDPNFIELRFDFALIQLAAGQIEAARAEYTQALALAEQQVAQARAAKQQPPASLWETLDISAGSLDDLLGRINNPEDTGYEAPPPSTLPNPEATGAAIEELISQVKSASVALEYTDKLPTGQVTAQFSPFTFAEAIYDESGEFLDYEATDEFPPETAEVLILFDYQGMADGQELVVKVYYNYEEDLTWRRVEDWSLGAEGSAEYPLSVAYSDVYTLSPGEYIVEMYVDSHLIQRGSFVIAEEELASSSN